MGMANEAENGFHPFHVLVCVCHGLSGSWKWVLNRFVFHRSETVTKTENVW